LLIRSEKLTVRLGRFLAEHTIVGFRTSRERMRFIEKLVESQRKCQAFRHRMFLGGTDPLSDKFHPFRCILSNFENGDFDEAVWLGFLCVHFGWDGNPKTRETIRRFYSRFDQGLWNWKNVARNPLSVRDWMRENSRRLSELKFGNHRKYESNKPDSDVGTPAVIESFVRWAAVHGNGSAYKAFQSFVQPSASPEVAFENLFRALDIHRFGRTARFDFLCLLGDLGILAVAPAHPYLRGATGPKDGAILLVTGKKGGKLTTEVVDIVRDLQAALGVPAECMEDALCNWQKKAGFLSRTC